ncbi:MAG: hypothetical protein ACI4US_05375 [Muribaculaceae bacterium]
MNKVGILGLSPVVFSAKLTKFSAPTSPFSRQSFQHIVNKTHNLLNDISRSPRKKNSTAGRFSFTPRCVGFLSIHANKRNLSIRPYTPSNLQTAQITIHQNSINIVPNVQFSQLLIY